jgi:hypothetical protein
MSALDGILRVFARRTTMTPRDAWAIVGDPGLFLPDGIREVRVCAVYTWDLPECERLVRTYTARLPGVPVLLGGPATGMIGEEHVPGMFTRTGCVITSRGCPNRCWFCSVWKREGTVRTFAIRDGYNILDDNLLACPDDHVRAVFAMLKRQARQWPYRDRQGRRHYRRPEFTGGLEAARLQDWHADALLALKPERLFFAYDTPDDWEPLVCATLKLVARGMPTAGNRIAAYVLCGFPRDTMAAADLRMRETLALGVMPQAMLWQDDDGRPNDEWGPFARTWARPAIIAARARRT